eukprot:m.71279 g.71279  ORF g.71279 m.71279 type:complete len:322 (-) comp12230_c0_seq4:86-1051(-)
MKNHFCILFVVFATGFSEVTVQVDPVADMGALNPNNDKINEHERSFPPCDSIEELKQQGYNATLIKEDPLLFTIDDFVTDEEINFIISSVNSSMTRSTGGMEREVSSYRTSSTAWINNRSIVASPVIVSLRKRIANILNVPQENQEQFQVLRYFPNQFYRRHHDWVPEHATAPCGPRIATFFIYLNDVEEGGATDFPVLGVAVKPKKGKVAVWYNAFPTNPPTIDTRVDHEATDIIRGEKWAANVWVHVNDFENNYYKGNLWSMERGKAFQKTASGCSNANQHCEGWAATGECDKNPGYMLVYCKKACKVCTEETPKKDEL